jgi:pyrroline-5-carboxylate reductase
MILLPSPDNPMLLFGCGNMGGAMLTGWLAAGFDPASFVVVDPRAAAFPDGVIRHDDVDAAGRQFSLALLAVKPQIFAEVAGALEQTLAPDALLLSILAGTRTEMLTEALPGRTIVRVMPNLAAALGKSPLGLFSKAAVDRSAVETLLAPLGQAFWLADEGQMDAVTALAGSGPAFVYRFIDALAKAGVRLGLDENASLGLARNMVEGAGELAAISDEAPSDLARRVTSPGGTTAAGLAVLDDNSALDRLIEATLTAARDRGVELSKG